jgi:hypothetical protein
VACFLLESNRSFSFFFFEGNVTYQSVWLDGVEKEINQTVPSAFALNWGQHC